MSTLTFKQYLSVIEEDAAQDIAKLSADISTIDAQIGQRTKPLLDRKAQLQKLLAIKQKQSQAEEKRAPTDTNQMVSDQQSSNQTTTPGSSRSATPGGGG